MKRFLNIKFLATIGIIGLLFTVAQVFIYYSKYDDTTLAKTLEQSQVFIDTLDGEIENANNPDITVEATGGLASSQITKPNITSEARNGPNRLIIEKLGIDAFIQYVGISKTGNMAVPTNFKDVGWYKLGVKPGEKGNAVIAGHLDNALGLAGVFKKLQTLQQGDIIKVKNEDGKILQFKVSSTKTYAYNDNNTSEVFTGTGNSRLALITCGGTWIQSEKSYDKRIAVFADLI